ncbi:KilA-N domain-containing protein [Vibrio casei]|uniref:KilA-N domain-containing protein n=1 Tax=Vibrio casei TaxID=673372 RepID=UPI003F97EA5D
MKHLLISNNEIRINEDGLYNLNDLHEASGGDKRHLPSQFMRSNNFKEVVDILTVQNSTIKPFERKTGRYGGGTWVCKELVYKYAMWVSAKFEVMVIQTFDKAASGNSPVSMREMNELVKKIESDKSLASFCGTELAKYKQVKKDNETKFKDGINSVQISLGLK